MMIFVVTLLPRAAYVLQQAVHNIVYVIQLVVHNDSYVVQLVVHSISHTTGCTEIINCWTV